MIELFKENDFCKLCTVHIARKILIAAHGITSHKVDFTKANQLRRNRVETMESLSMAFPLTVQRACQHERD